MKAAILREFKAPSGIEEIDQPKPGAHDVLIEVEVCGVWAVGTRTPLKGAKQPCDFSEPVT